MRVDFQEANEILLNYYANFPSCYHDERHAANVLLFTLFCAEFVTMYMSELSSQDLTVLYYVALFHDSGRMGRDGNDYYASISAKLAYQYVAEKYGEYSPIAYRVYTIILHEIAPSRLPLSQRDQLLFDIYKGADSLDIMRVLPFKEHRNPLMRRASGKCLTALRDLAKDVYNLSLIEKSTIYKGKYPHQLRMRGRHTIMQDACMFMVMFESKLPIIADKCKNLLMN